MCYIFVEQSKERYTKRSRSIRLNGYSTSICLEACFWEWLEEISSKQNMSLSEFITTLYDEATEVHGEIENFTSLLRCACLIYVQQKNEKIFCLPTFQESTSTP